MKTLLKTQWIKYIISILTAVGLIILILNGYVVYDTCDDLLLQVFTQGTLGYYSPFDVHNNLLWAHLLVWMNSHIETLSINWDIFLQLLLLVIAYSLLMYSLVDRRGIIGTLEGLSIVFLTIFSIFHRFNYTKTSSILMMVGAILLASYVKKKNNFIATISVILIIVGSLLRWNSNQAIIPFLFVCFIYGLAQLKRSEYKRYCIPWVLSSLIILVMWGYHFNVYYSDDTWRDYKSLRKVRAALQDYGMYPWEGYSDAYQERGWSESEVKQFLNGVHADSEVYTYEKLIIADTIDEDPRPIYSVRRWAHTVKVVAQSIFKCLRFSFTNELFIYCLVRTILIIIHSKKDRYYAITFFVLLVLELSYLFVGGRTVERATIIPLVCCILGLSLLDSERQFWKHEIIICAFVFVFMGTFRIPFEGSQTYSRRHQYEQCIEYIAEHEFNLFIWDTETFADGLKASYSPVYKLERSMFKNSTVLGSWIAPTPQLRAQGDAYGNGANLMRILAENSSVYYVSNWEPLDSMYDYLYEHYNYSGEAKEITSFGRYHIYSFNSEKL